MIDTVEWRTVIREPFKQRQDPCARCGTPIDYGGTYFIKGTRKKNPRYLHVGHIVERDRAIDLGWTDAMINDPSNLQAECGDCSNKSGARYGRSKQNKLQPVRTKPIVLDTSREW